MISVEHLTKCYGDFTAVDGETFALVPHSDVVDLIEAVNAIVLN